MMNIGRMKIAAVRLYNEFLTKIAAAEDEGYRRYRGLMDFISTPSGTDNKLEIKEGAEVGEDRTEEIARGRRQEERHVGQHGLNEAFGQWFRDMLEDYLPGGFLDDPKKTKGMYGSEGIRGLTDDFYRLSYKGFSDLLPKLVAQRLKKEGISDVSASEIKFTPDLINRVITDAVNYFHDHPDEIRGGLIRAYTKKFQTEGDEESRDLGVGQAFFRPKVDQEYYSELQKKSEATGEEPELSIGDVDSGVLKNLEGIAERGVPVRWKWSGIDEGGMLKFTMPDLYGKREFLIKLPQDIGTIRPGEYNFKIRKVMKNGAIIEFVEQKQGIHDRYSQQVAEGGLGVDQLRAFINNGFINRYMSVMRAEPIEKLIEDFSGQVTVGGEQVGSVDEIAELGDTSGKGIPKARGTEKIEEKRQEMQGELDRQTDKIMQRWESSPALQKMYLSMSSSDGDRIADVVASKFPEESTKSTIGLPSIIATRPIVRFVMRTIMDPTTPMAGGGKADPWITMTINHIRQHAVQDPKLLDQFTKLMQVSQTRQEKKPGTSKKDPAPLAVPAVGVGVGVGVEAAGESAPVSVSEVQAFINSIPETHFRVALNNLKAQIQAAMQESASDPALRKFFDRKKSFDTYKEKIVGPFINELLYISELDPSDPEEARYRRERGRAIGVISPDKLPPIDPDTDEGRKIIDRQVGAFINRSVKKMGQPGLAMTASEIDPTTIQRVIARAYHRVTAGCV